MAEGAALSYFLELQAKLDQKSLAGVESAAKKFIEGLSSSLPPVLIKVGLDDSSLKKVEAQLKTIGVGSGGGNGSTAAADVRILNGIDDLKRATGRGGGGRSGGGESSEEKEAKQRFKFELAGASRSQIGRIGSALEAVFKEDEKAKLAVAYSGKGSGYKGEVSSKQDIAGLMSAISEQAASMEGAGTLGKLRVSGILDDLGAVSELIQEARTISGEIEASKPKKPPKSVAQKETDAEREARIEREANLRERNKQKSPFAQGWEQASRTQRGENPDIDWDRDRRLRAANAQWIKGQSEIDSTPEGARQKQFDQIYQRILPAYTTSAEAAAKATALQAQQNKKLRESVEGSIEPLSVAGRMFKAISEGGIRRGVAMGVSGALGGGPIASLVGGMTGAIASSLALPIAWAIGDAVMSVPKDLMKESEQRARVMAGGATPEEQAALDEMGNRGRRYWAAAVTGGDEIWRGIAEQLQDNKIPTGEIEDLANQLMALRGGSAGGNADIAQQYTEMRYRRTPETMRAFVESNRFVEQALMEMYGERLGISHLPVSAQKNALMQYIGPNIGVKDIETAMEIAVRDPKVHGRLEASAGSWLGGLQAAWQTVKHPLYGLSNPEGELYSSGGYPRTRGGPRGPHEFNPEPVASQFRWTSFSGLADQMQTMWSGAPPLIDNTNAVEKNTSALHRLMELIQGSGGGSTDGSVAWQNFFEGIVKGIVPNGN